jgi:hypothetical protein
MRRSAPVLLLVAALLLLPALPDLFEWLRRQRQGPAGPGEGRELAASAAWGPGAARDPSRSPLALLEEGLLERLRLADRDWIPRAEPLADGGVRYLYRRRPGDPELSIAQIEALIAHPPDHARERTAIVALLRLLDRVGAGLSLSEPLKPGAAAEWDAQQRLLRIRPSVPERGSIEFFRVLNHEAVHVAQSCAAGGLGASPRPLGVSGRPTSELSQGGSRAERRAARDPWPDGPAGGLSLPGEADPTGSAPLDDPLYADLSPLERRMEEEAYALQARLGLGERLVRLHCRNGRAD